MPGWQAGQQWSTVTEALQEAERECRELIPFRHASQPWRPASSGAVDLNTVELGSARRKRPLGTSALVLPPEDAFWRVGVPDDRSSSQQHWG